MLGHYGTAFVQFGWMMLVEMSDAQVRFTLHHGLVETAYSPKTVVFFTIHQGHLPLNHEMITI